MVEEGSAESGDGNDESGMPDVSPLSPQDADENALPSLPPP